MREGDAVGVSDRALATAGLKAGVRVLDQWGASEEQGARILHVSRERYARAKRHPLRRGVRLNVDQLTRILGVLHIQATLRRGLGEPGRYMARPNSHAYFSSRSPLDVLAKGDTDVFDETLHCLQDLMAATRY